MKDKIKLYQMSKGTYDPDWDFELQEDNEIKRVARKKFDELIDDKNPIDKKKLLVETFEGLLYEKWRLEWEYLNVKRAKEFEKNRPPQQKWYELKSPQFAEELYRNRMELKPNEQNKQYLQTLQDNYLY